jgi:hypothetical protein
VPESNGKHSEESRSYAVADQLVELSGKKAGEDYPEKLRVVTYWIQEKKGSNR